MGRVAGLTERYVLELQQWQCIIEAPPASALAPTGTAVVYGQTAFDGEQILEVNRSFPR